MNVRKRLLSVLALTLIIALTLTMLATPIAAVSQADIDALKEQKAEIESSQADIQAEIDRLQSEQATVLEKKAALDEQNELARQEIELINEQIDIYDKIIAQKGIELEEAISEENAQMERYRVRMRAMEEEGAVSYLAVLFNATSFTDLLSRIDFVREIMEYDSELEDSCIEAREHVQEVKADYEAVQVEQEATKAELLDRKEDLERQIEAAYEMIAAIEADIESNQEEYLANERAEQELDGEINDLIAKLEEQRKAAEAAAAAAAAVNGTGGSTTPSTQVASGMFIWPTTAYTVTSPWGYRTHPIFGTQKFHAGIDIGVGSGQPIYAAASGTVVTASPSDSYGNYVMIAHSNGYYTLYAHQTRYIVSVGQTVSQGEVIGYVGSTGWSTGPHLHFEVRVNGSTVDPMSFY